MLIAALIILAPHAVAAQMLSGSYVGDGLDDVAITELGFQPDVVIIKGDNTQIGVLRTSTMTGDAAKPMTGGTALTANLIQSLDPSGFTIGSDPRVNSLLITYYWVAFKATTGKMKVGTYTGNGALGRAITGVGFPLETVFVISAGATRPVAVTETSLAAGRNGLDFFTTSAGGWFTSLDQDGFTLTNGAAEVNASATTYHYIAWNDVDGQMTQGTYVGNGADNRNITGVGFEPEYVITFSSNGQEATQHSGAIGAAVDDSMFFAGIAGLTNRVQALQADGFQVGSALDVNENTRNHFYIAWTRIQGPPQMISGSYTGNAADNRAITGLGFRPDFVIVKAETAQTGVFRSSRMTGDVSKPAVGATALTANLVQSLNADGFTVGTDARVNGSGVEYHWIAFSTGAGEMVVNNYTGNGADNRNITGIGFQANYLIIMPEGANDAVHRSSAMIGDISFEFDITGSATNLIQAFQADGFQVGTDARVNTSGAVYQYVAFNQIAGKMMVGSYSGNATDNRSITGVGFQPEYVIVRPSSSNSTVHHSNAMGASTDQSERFWASAGLTNSIQALEADGFQVGTDATVNGSGNTYYWMAWKRPTLTAVRMASTKALRTPNGVTVTWRTGYEVDNLGFEVYREVGGEHTKITSKVIAGSALFVPPGIAMSAGRPYTWTDESPLALEKGVQYWVEDIDLNGKRTLHGPIVPSSDKDKDQKTGAEQPSAPPRDGAAPTPPRAEAVQPETGTANSPLLHELTLSRDQPDESPVRDPSAPASVPALATTPTGPIYFGVPVARPPVRPSATAAPPRVTPAPQVASVAVARTSTTQQAPSGAAQASVPAARGGAPAPAMSTGSQAGGAIGSVAGPSAAQTMVLAAPVSQEPPAPPGGLAVVTPPAPPALRTRRSIVSTPSGTPRPEPAAAVLEQWTIASQAGARIAVRTAGWYRLTQPALVAAGINPAVDPRNLRLVVDGVERPMIVTGESDGTFDAGDTVEFYGTGVDTPYTDLRAYWLTTGASAGLRLPAVDATAAGTAAGSSFAHTVERKDREVYFGGLQNGDEENFFGPLIMEGSPTTQQLTLPHVADPPAAEAHLEVSLQGVTELQAANDHRVGVLVNGAEVGEMVFDGRAAAVSAFPLAHALLTSGLNTVSFEARGGVDDMSLVESVRLTYQRAYRADADQVTLTATAGQQLTLTGFTNAAIRVFDVTGDLASQELLGTVAADGSDWSITFTVPAGAARRLFVTTSDLVNAPASVQANAPSTLHTAGQSGEVVMIADMAFAAALDPLKSLRQSQGYAVQVVDVQDVYDEFAFGQKTPDAIRAFLIRAAESWAKPPRFVLLVGNATTDPRDYQGLGEPDFVPTRIVPTGILETASDDWFADADGDSFADLASVGRLPARSAADVTTMVDKIVAYEQSASETWHRTVLLASDHGDENPDAFANLNTSVGSLVPGDYQVHHVRRDQDPDPAATLRTRLSDGAFLLNYQGHGSVDMWRGDVLTAADVPTLGNGSRLPLVVAMTCFGGFFHGLFPEESLAEALLRASNGGAVGVWASSGMTDSRWQASMDRELFRQIFGGSWTSVGEAIQAAKKVVGDPDVRRTWIYFGDPALRLKGMSRPPVESSPTVTPVSSPPDPPDSEDSSDQNDGRYRRPANSNVRMADFDGDGKTDALVVQPETGLWFSALGEPGSFRYTPGQFGVTGEPMALDLNDDNLADLFVYNPQTGDWLKALSLGDGRFSTWSGVWAQGLQVVAGDFDGNGRDDLFAHDPVGMWFQAFSTSDADFSYRYGTQLQMGDAYVGDFNGDARADVFVYNGTTGAWTMAFSTISGPSMTQGMWTPGWQLVVANLNGDTSADLVLWHAASGTWVHCLRDASQFFVYRTGTWTPGGRLHAANLLGDGRDELLRYDWRTGDWTLATLNLAGDVQQWDSLWETGWEMTPGDLNGDGRDDLLLYNPDTGQWTRRLNLVSGWVDDVSGLWSRNWMVAGRRR